MTATYQADGSKRDQVRLLISDTDTTNPVFQDAEIEQFLALRRDNVFLAAALGLRTIAGNEAQTLKVIQLLDLNTDGASLSRELRIHATELEQQAGVKGQFAVAEFTLTPSARRQRLWDEVRRGAL